MVLSAENKEQLKIAIQNKVPDGGRNQALLTTQNEVEKTKCVWEEEAGRFVMRTINCDGVIKLTKMINDFFEKNEKKSKQ